MLDNSNVEKFDVPEKQLTHGPCPRCGEPSSGHVTIVDAAKQLGRRCLECSCTFAIARLEELTEEQHAQNDARIRNRAMEEKIRRGEAICADDVGICIDAEKNIWQLPEYIDGKDYCVRSQEMWIWSIGRHRETGQIFASTSAIYYRNPGFECLFLR